MPNLIEEQLKLSKNFDAKMQIKSYEASSEKVAILFEVKNPWINDNTKKETSFMSFISSNDTEISMVKCNGKVETKTRKIKLKQRRRIVSDSG